MLRVNARMKPHEIAAESDVMVVVGDRKSANTQHLAEICRQNCSRVLQIEARTSFPPQSLQAAVLPGLRPVHPHPRASLRR